MSEQATRLRAVLFDLDGTLADTEPLWAAAKSAVALRHRLAWTAEDSAWAVGRPTPEYSAEFVARGARGTVAEIADEITAHVAAGLDAGIVWRPGALALLAELTRAGVRTGLVTMAYRPVAEALAAATGLPVFDVIVAGDDVSQSKPHPEPYLRAMTALGVTPDVCVAVEDTETGARSAGAAGLATVVVPSASDVAPGPGRLFRASLDGVGLDDLRAVLDRE